MTTIQVLITTMHADGFEKVEQMNLKNVDVVIANQTDYCSYEERDFPEKKVHACMVSTNTTGAGLNRNIALAYASADIILFADDDMEFTEGFADEVLHNFEIHPEIQAVKYFCCSRGKTPLSFYRPLEFARAGLRQLMCAGVVGLAIRRKCIEHYDLAFPCSIGPGRIYNCGEDSVFMHSLVKTHEQVYVSPYQIAWVDQRKSSWFTGYNEHYFETKGYVYTKIYGRLALLMITRFAIKMSRKTAYSVMEIISMMCRGADVYKS